MWLSVFWEKIKYQFSRRSRSVDSQVSSKKKFLIHNNGGSQNRGGDSFVIFKIKSVSQSERRGSAKMKVVSESRPRKCPRCRAEKTIIKLEGTLYKWECCISKNGCGYKW